MPIITLYSKPDCHLCETTRAHLQDLVATLPQGGAWQIQEVSILDDAALFRAYHETIPVVAVEGGPTLAAPASLDRAQLYVALASSVASRQSPVTNGGGIPPGAAPNTQYATRNMYAPGGFWQRVDRWGSNLGNNWLTVFNGVLGVFVSLPWLAPIFARLGWWVVADPIYTAYMLFCHQLPERAAFVFGYQVAYCWRNTAIYTTIFLCGLLFAWVRRTEPAGRLRGWMQPMALPLFVLALLPIGVDGLTHMFGLRETNTWFDALTGGQLGSFSVGDAAGTLNWWLRVISGSLFGYALVRMVFPWVYRAVDMAQRLPAWPPLPPAQA
jgi:uncharacterized membrane protein